MDKKLISWFSDNSTKILCVAVSIEVLYGIGYLLGKAIYYLVNA
jgi:hypothetical protein